MLTTRLALGLLILLTSLYCAAATEDVSVPIADVSPSGSPFTNTGRAILSESATNSGMVLNHTEQWSARNHSAKSIVAVVETLRLHYPNGSEMGITYQHDTFFHPKPVLSGEDIEFMSVDPGTALRAPASQNVRDASCDIVVRWVQFADGTTFGDPSYAANLVGGRAAILKELRRLASIYQSEGLTRFSTELQRRSGTDADGFI